METTNATATEPAGTERIVSVNDYGRTGINSWHRIARVALIVAVLSAAVAMSVHRAKAYIRAKSAPQIQEQRQATTAEAQPGRRTFPASAIPTAPAATPPATPGAAKLSDIQGCADGQPSEPMKAQDGTLILTPTGLPVRVCHDGQILIPPLPMPAQQPQPAYQAHAANQSAGMATAAAAPAIKRDDGDIVLSQRDAALSNNGPHTAQATADGQFAARALTDGDARDAGDSATGSHRSLKSLLRAAPAVAVQAQRIGDRNMLLPEGRTIDCNLSLRVISEVSGMAVCVLSSYVYGDTGVVVLAEPGSVATGDYIAFSEQGQRRLFITWSRLKTTSGVIININSPASDALGTSGVEGYVDNRWADRIGAAVLLSSVKDVIGYQTARAGADRDNGGGVNVFPNTTEAGSRLAERILESTINIKPTIYKNQGDRASITVRRDLDFGSVYVLQSK